MIERTGLIPASMAVAASQPSRRWRTLVPVLLAIFVLGAGFAAGIRSGLRDTIGHVFIDLSALTATLSSEYHGLTGHPYQGFLSVRSALQENGLSVNKQNFPSNFRDYPTLMRALQAAKVVGTCGSPLVSDSYNDQGVFDFFRGSFSIFGADVRSTYYFYFLLVGASAGIYLFCFWRDYAACALLFACACAIYSFMPSYVLSNNQLISVSNTRFLSTLGIIPLLHVLIMLITERTPRTDWAPLIALIAQSAIMELAIAARATAQWMEIAFAFVVAVYLFRTGINAFRERTCAAVWSFLFSRGATALYVVATLALIGSVRAVSLPPSCGTAINAHPFWHNVFLGLSFDPGWKAKMGELGLAADAQGDQMVFAVAQLYAEEHNLPYQTKPSIWISTPETRAAGIDTVPFGSWQIYESIVRKAFFEFVRKHPVFTLRVFLIQKPKLFIHHTYKFFVEVLGHLTLLDMIALVSMIIAIGVSAPLVDGEREDAEGRMRRSLFLVTYCFAISMIPLFVVYPDDYLIVDQAYLVVAIVVMGLIWGVISERSVARRRAQAANWVSARPDVSLRG